MRYAEGRDTDLRMAMNVAKKSFMDQFGYEPEQDETVFECIGVTGGWVVDIYELKEDTRESSKT
jgi:hypothetical protein